MIFLACIGFFLLAHVAAITHMLTTMTGSGGTLPCPLKYFLAASLAIVHVVIETGWTAALCFATVLGAAMATEPLHLDGLGWELVSFITIPVFLLTLVMLQILGKTTKSFKLNGWSAAVVAGALIAVDLAFNTGTAIAATTVFYNAKF